MEWLLQRVPRWDALRNVGNARLVKLTIVVPILGYMILFNEKLTDYYALSVQFLPAQSILLVLFSPGEDAKEAVSASYRLYCFYFGFTLLGCASLLFLWRCPRLVRLYGSAAAFVAREERTVLPGRLYRMVNAIQQRRLQTTFPHLGYSLDEVRRFSLSHKAIVLSEGPDSYGGIAPKDTKAVPTEDLQKLNAAKEIIAIGGVSDEIFTGLAVRGTAGPNIPHIMTEWFVPLKDTEPYVRLIASILYALGFVILAIPTLDTFLLVLTTLWK
jgi:hypothetical protein